MSNEELAHEAFEKLSNSERKDGEAIILSAIERAHQDGWYEGRNFEIELQSQPAKAKE